MSEVNKKSFSYKVQKNPFLLGLILIMVIVIVAVTFILSSAIQEKANEIKSTTEASTQEVETTDSAPAEDNIIELEKIKKHVTELKSIRQKQLMTALSLQLLSIRRKTFLMLTLQAVAPLLTLFPYFIFT